MIKLIFLAVVIAVVLGVITYDGNKVVINTEKGKEVIEKSKKFVNENIEVK